MTATAQNPPNCRDVIKACDETIAEKNKALELADLTIKSCLTHGTRVQFQLNEAKEELDKWYRQPLLVFGIGVLVGGVSYSVLRK